MRLLVALTLLSTSAFGQINLPVLDPAKSAVNATLPTFSTRQQVLRQFGKPTRIRTADYECGLTEAQSEANVQQVYCYGKTEFYIYDAKADLMILDFRTGKLSYQTPRIKLSGQTTFADLQKVYPAATKAATKTPQGQLVVLAPCKECEGQVRLYFERGRLAQLEFWEPC
ncbi:hypothetical protein LGH70_06365 [Hymenobacter sp. BT635]|uniref:Uncharacterized protein n=1 Tax=Hymenobacter nitidus TaxID=2880929 RepID=A0ABS8A9X7_9BACT|nr:hypothetical protein [Hymenobacter nitidus]MCB2377198.1 hypothetical protein [Hymenobacter nitidus]